MLLAARSIEEGAIPELEGLSVSGRDVPFGSSRFDLELQDIIGQRMLVMVETLPSVRDGAALLPAGPQPRSARQLRALARAVESGQTAATVLFVAPRVDAHHLSLRPDLDPEYVEALREATQAGVRLLARRCQVTLAELGLGLALEIGLPA